MATLSSSLLLLLAVVVILVVFLLYLCFFFNCIFLWGCRIPLIVFFFFIFWSCHATLFLLFSFVSSFTLAVLSILRFSVDNFRAKYYGDFLLVLYRCLWVELTVKFDSETAAIVFDRSSADSSLFSADLRRFRPSKGVLLRSLSHIDRVFSADSVSNERVHRHRFSSTYHWVLSKRKSVGCSCELGDWLSVSLILPFGSL